MESFSGFLQNAHNIFETNYKLHRTFNFKIRMIILRLNCNRVTEYNCVVIHTTNFGEAMNVFKSNLFKKL